MESEARRGEPGDLIREGDVLAGTWSRLGAYLFDLMLLAVPLYAVRFLVTGSWTMWPATGEQLPARAAVSAVWLVPSAAYFVGFWTSRWQATLGMRLLRIRVDRQPEGGRLVPSAGLRRWGAVTGPGLLVPFALLAPVSSLIVPVLALDSLWTPILLVTVLSSPTRQGLHDRFAGSVVVALASGERKAVAVAIVAVYLGIYFAPVGLRMLFGGSP
jgi:uncharacterized RDD family membrane protein YckC